MTDLTSPSALAMFAAEYGVTDRATVGWAIQQGKQRAVEAMRYWPINSADAAEYLRLVATDLAWLARQQHALLQLLD